MAPDNRPGSRKKNIVEGEASIKRRGSGLDSKPIESTGHSSGSRPGGGVRAGGGIGIGTIIMVLVIIFFVMKFGSSDDYDGYPETAGQNTSTGAGSEEAFGGGSASGGLADVFGSLIGGYSTTESDYSSYETAQESSPAQLDMNVDPSARQKYTSIIGQGADVVTIMVYLCGTDLESRSGMGTADLQEMAAANLPITSIS